MKYCISWKQEMRANYVFILHKEMQRHKEPLSFAESPYDGVRHCRSPVLAAQRPFLASSISAELLTSQWVSPQFSNENQSCMDPKAGKKRQRAARTACRKSKTQKKNKQVVQIKENNVFPPLDFPSDTSEIFKHPNKQSKDNLFVQHRRSKRIKTKQPLNDVTLVDQQQTPDVNADKNHFLFSLGSPKPSRVLGEILVHETPENQMCERRMLDRRLSTINCKSKSQSDDRSKAQLS